MSASTAKHAVVRADRDIPAPPGQVYVGAARTAAAGTIMITPKFAAIWGGS
jgi:hypothetical protein